MGVIMKKNVFKGLAWIIGCALLTSQVIFAAKLRSNEKSSNPLTQKLKNQYAKRERRDARLLARQQQANNRAPLVSSVIPIDKESDKASKSLTFADLKQLTQVLDKTIFDFDKETFDFDRAKVCNQCRKQSLAVRLYEDFIPTLEKFIGVSKAQLNAQDRWLNGIMPHPDLYQLTYDSSKNIYAYSQRFVPFVQRLTFEVGNQIRPWGDLHGGFHSLINTLCDLHQKKVLDDNLKIINPKKNYLMFLGDFVDRGAYGVEVIYTLMQLKLRNPNNVILVRGNHESIAQNLDQGTSGGFAQELSLKVRQHGAYNEQAHFIEIFYNLLPVACIINKETLACHGGLDMAYDKKPLANHPNPVVQFELITEKNYDASKLKLAAKDKNFIFEEAREYCKPRLAGWKDDATKDCNQYMQSCSGFLQRIDQLLDKVILDEAANRQYNNKAGDLSTGTELEGSIAALNFNSDRKNFDTALKAYEDSVVNMANNKIAQVRALLPPKSDMAEEGTQLAEGLALFDTARATNPKQFMDYLKAYQFITQRLKAIKKQIDGDDDKASDTKYSEDASQIQRLISTVSGMDDIIELLNKFFAPYQPTAPDALYKMGFPWHDFCWCDCKKGRLCLNVKHKLDIPENVTRVAFGKDLTRAILDAQGFKVVLRAHQHGGDMVPLLERSNGIAVLWDFSAEEEKFALRQGMVCTFQVAPSSGMVDLDYDPYGLLTIGATTETSTIEKIRVKRQRALQTPLTATVVAATQPMPSSASDVKTPLVVDTPKTAAATATATTQAPLAAAAAMASATTQTAATPPTTAASIPAASPVETGAEQTVLKPLRRSPPGIIEKGQS